MAERYYIEWTSNTGEDCRLAIDDSQWTYSSTRLKGSGRSPAVREHQADQEDVLATIRPVRLTVRYIDEGSQGIDVFSTGDAYRFKATLTVDSVTKFVGYYVPDDLQQDVRYQPTEVTLTFTDGIGLLRNVPLSETELNTDADKYSLLDIVRACLLKTGLSLPFRTFANLYANGLMVQRYDSNTADPIFQARQKLKSYVTSSNDELTWMNCYDVLTRIIRDWNATLYQEDGYWYIVRMPELAAGAPNGTQYDEDLYNATARTTDFADVTDLKAISRTQLKTLVRPASKIVNTYDYKVVPLLLNAKLLRLGAFISSVVVDDTTVESYALDVWQNVGGCNAVIKVVRDTVTEKELDRYVEWSWAASLENGIYSNEFDVNAGDRFDFGFDLRAATDSNFASAQSMGLWLKGVSNQEYVCVPQPFDPLSRAWIPTDQVIPTPVGDYDNPSVTYGRKWQGREDIRDVHRLTLTEGYLQNTLPFPEDGKMRVAVFGFNDTGSRLANKDSIVNGMQFDYYLYVSKSIRVQGEVHTVTQTSDLNSEFNRDVYTADSPKSNVAGTLFVNDTKTENWGTEQWPFAKYSIMDEAMLRGVTRLKLEGDFRNILSMNKVLAPTFLPDRRLFPNRLTVDYGQGISSLFADEVSGPNDIGYEDVEYSFNYLYE